jgi:hypothetical protein
MIIDILVCDTYDNFQNRIWIWVLFRYFFGYSFFYVKDLMCCLHVGVSGTYDKFQNKNHLTMRFVWIFIFLCVEFCVFF